MQYVKTLLSVSLIFGTFHVQAQALDNVTDTPKAVAPSPDMQVAQSNGVTTQLKNTKVSANRPQSKVPTQNPTYEVPLGDYNNDGHFGD